MNPILYYDPIALQSAWAKLLRCSSSFLDQATYRYDLVDITRQVLSNLLLKVHNEFVEAFNQKDLNNLELRGNSLLSIIKDIDRILASDQHWLLVSKHGFIRSHG